MENKATMSPEERRASMHASVAQLMQKQERLSQALNEWDAALKLAPGRSDWRAQRAEVNLRLSNLERAGEDALDLYTAEQTNPKFVDLVGRLMLQAQRFDEAVLFFRQAIGLQPDVLSHYFNLARAFRALGDMGSSVAILSALSEELPTEIDIYYILVDFLFAEHKNDEALAAAMRAAEKIPGVDSLRMLANAYIAIGDYSKARVKLGEALKLVPNDLYLSHMAASLDREAPNRVNPEFIKMLYNVAASSYDITMVVESQYRVPLFAYNQFIKHRPDYDLGHPDAKKLVGHLDLGCGTGQVAVMFNGVSSFLRGIDLSVNMVRLASRLGVYSELSTADIKSELEIDARLYELVTAIDSLGSFGDLSEVVGSVVKRLLPSGLFIFTVEPTDDARSYHLNERGNMMHNLAYVDDVLAKAGLNTLSVMTEPMYVRNGKQVNLALYVCERPVLN